MIYSNEFNKYSKKQKDTISKLLAFADRCPVLISIYTDTEKISITHISSGIVYDFKWSSFEDLEPKDFVAQVKKKLVTLHYPRLIRTVKIQRPYTATEIADGLVSGKSISDFENHLVEEEKSEIYRIESVMLWQNKFILKEDQADSKTSYIWKLKPSGAIFLTKYRNQEFDTLEEASQYFFDNADLIKVISKEE